MHVGTEAPAVDVPVPNPVDGVNEDSVMDGFTSFMIDNYRYVSVAIIIAIMMMMWKRPLWRGIMLGVLILAVILFITSN